MGYSPLSSSPLPPKCSNTATDTLSFILYLGKRCKYGFYIISGISLLYIILLTIKLQSNMFNHQSPTPKPNESLACQIAKLEPFDPLIKDALESEDQYLKSFKRVTCLESFPLLFSSSLDRLIPLRSVEDYKENYTISSCCYRTIHRGGNPSLPKTFPDHTYNLSKSCYPVSLSSDTVVAPDHDFVSIECNHDKPIVKSFGKNDNPAVRKGAATLLNSIVDMHAFVHPPPPESRTASNYGGDRLNILILGLDAVSRMNFIRSFPKSYDYLMKSMTALEMEMYNKIGDNSLPNLGPMLTNAESVAEANLTCEVDRAYDKCPFIWERFEEVGYHTFYAEDDKRLSIFDYVKNGFLNPPTHYYFRPFSCAADAIIATKKLMFAKICYGPRFAYQVMLHYVKKMVKVMESIKENYFLFTWSSSLTHDFLHAGMHADSRLHSFLEWMKDGGYMNNTFIVVMGDHGARWGPLRGFYQGQLEERLPAMYFVLPQWFQDKYSTAYRNLMTNRKRLVTVWDLHQTLGDLVNLEESIGDDVLDERERELKVRLSSPLEESPGISMFLPIPLSRTCKDAGIPDNYCTCNHETIPVDITNSEVELGTHFAVNSINIGLESSNFTNCAKLELEKIISAGKVSFGETQLWQGYQINFQTQPGSGQFEALVVHDEMPLAESNWTIQGKVLRTNLYGNQSYCVDDKNAKLYCYCI